VVVRIGSLKTDSGGFTFDSEAIFVHPMYDTISHDIAVIRLTSPAKCMYTYDLHNIKCKKYISLYLDDFFFFVCMSY
jgi:hypothetical protein